jgi:recombinational DNA repair protein (RecF pathway)
MSASRQARILLLSKVPSGERFWQCSILSPELGGCICLLRRSGNGKSGMQRVEPDLFDTATVQVRKPSGSDVLYFAEDYELVRRRSGLGQRYATFQAGSFWAGLLALNLAAVPEDAEGAFFAHAERTLDHLEQGFPAEWVLLKALYLLLKLEGYPVRESWWQGLSAKDQKMASNWLGRALEHAPPDDPTQLGGIFRKLRNWTVAHTELQLPLWQ